jgi:ceramide synthetase
LIDEGKFPVLEQLAPAFTYCIILSAIRYLLQNFFMVPLAEWSMQIKSIPFVPVRDIDRVFPFKGAKVVYSTSDVDDFCKESGRQVADVKKYLTTRKRHHVNKKKIVKYVEAFWRFIFYSSFSYLGYRTLFVPEVAEWVQDTKNHWEGWPYHQITSIALFYYHIELGSYIHQLLWTESNHSDFWEMFAHHIITIALIVISFITNYWRVGVSILFLHDLSDVFLEGCKVLNYTSKPASRRWIKDYIVDPGFGLFTVVFFITRLVLFPRYILYSVFIEGYRVYGCEWGGCPIFIGLLSALQCLHIFWFYLIMRMVVKLFMGQMEGDVRSDDDVEEEKDEGHDEEPKNVCATKKTAKESKKAK